MIKINRGFPILGLEPWNERQKVKGPCGRNVRNLKNSILTVEPALMNSSGRTLPKDILGINRELVGRRGTEDCRRLIGAASELIAQPCSKHAKRNYV